MIDVKRAAEGRWRDILLELGIDAKHLGINKPCPVCPASTDRFSFTDKGQGFYVCRAGHRGDGFKLLLEVFGWDFKQAAREVEKVLGKVPDAPKRKTKRDPSKLLNAVYKGSVPVFAGCTVDRYLKARGLSVPPESLRYHPSLELYQERTLVGTYAAMIAMFTDAQGDPITIHRTYLEGDKKAPVEAPKMFMPSSKSIKGGSVKLWPADSEVVLAEGIETAAAASEIFSLPAYACIGTYGLETVELPKSIKRVVIAIDHDLNFAGFKAGYAAAARLYSEGRTVRVETPPIPGSDFLEELLIRRGKR